MRFIVYSFLLALVFSCDPTSFRVEYLGESGAVKPYVELTEVSINKLACDKFSNDCPISIGVLPILHNPTSKYYKGFVKCEYNTDFELVGVIYERNIILAPRKSLVMPNFSTFVRVHKSYDGGISITCFAKYILY